MIRTRYNSSGQPGGENMAQGGDQQDGPLLRPLQEDSVVNLGALPGQLQSLADEIDRWAEQRKLPAFRVPPVTTTSDGGDLWALRTDIDALAAGEDLEPPLRQDNDYYEVYVIELAGCDEHPNGCLYVGQSYRSDRNRFIQHLVGYKSGQKRVTKWGKRLRRDLYQDLPACKTKQEVEGLEAKTARRLADEGWSVHPSSLLQQ